MSRFVKRPVLLIVVMLLAANLLVIQVKATEPTLIEVFNALGFTNVAMSSVETFGSGTYNIT